MARGRYEITSAENGGWHWKVSGPKANTLDGWTKGPKKNAERSASRALKRLRDMNNGTLDYNFRVSAGG